MRMRALSPTCVKIHFVGSASILEIRILVSHNVTYIHTELFSLEYRELMLALEFISYTDNASVLCIIH